MTVYVVQEPTRNRQGFLPNLDLANDFGERKFVFPADRKVHALPVPSINSADRILKDFDPENDFLLWPNFGDPSALIICSMVLAKLGFSKIRVLHFNRPHGRKKRSFYAPVEYNLSKYLRLSQ